MARRSATVQLDFPFYQHLLDFYHVNRGKIRRRYKEITNKFLTFNNPEKADRPFLRLPQYEALEIYIFLKEFCDNPAIHQLFDKWAKREGWFLDRLAARTGIEQGALFEAQTREEYDLIFRNLRGYARTYPSYIFALTMGTGKTILMATCIFYEFLLANKFPKDPRFCHNALVFAPDTTVLQSLREIQTFDKSLVVPPEYVNWLNSSLRFHYLDEAGTTLNVIDGSKFNLIISNTQKVILKRKHREETAINRLMQPTLPPTKGSVYDEFSSMLDDLDIDSDEGLTSNQRYKKLEQMTQLGIYVDEAHHAFGKKLAEDMGTKETTTSLRLTIDKLAASLKQAGTHVVACYNYTGTPYVENRVLPEVVYAFGLTEAIRRHYLKAVRINSYANTRTSEFIDIAIDNFVTQVPVQQRHEQLLPKMAFFAATIEELQNDLRPAVEAALARHGIPASAILVNVGDPKLTSNDAIREFNRLDTPGSEKQFILLVNKGREGWNCRSLFAVALFRQPKSKVFVLQASMRCLRAIGDIQNRGHVYLSEDNAKILDEELQQNFRVDMRDLQNEGDADKTKIQIHVKEPAVMVKLTRIQRRYEARRKHPGQGIDLGLAEAPTEQYHMQVRSRESFDPTRSETTTDITEQRERRTFSALTLVAEIGRYLNCSCLEIEDILRGTTEGIDAIVAHVNTFNELLYDWIIPRLFSEMVELRQFEHHEVYEVALVEVPAKGYYEVTTSPEQLVREADAGAYAGKSFHLDAYSFDSQPEKMLFWELLRHGHVEQVYFTGMLTHGQTKFFIQYIDPETHTIRSYYPDFLIQNKDGTYTIIEVKGDHMIDDAVVQAKASSAQMLAQASGMTYRMIAGSVVQQGQTAWIWDPNWQAPRQLHLDGER